MELDGPMDDMHSSDLADRMKMGRDTQYKDREKIPKTSGKRSNLSKALRIKHLVNIAKRDRSKNPGMDDNPHQYNLGGHVSTNGAGLSR